MLFYQTIFNVIIWDRSPKIGPQTFRLNPIRDVIGNPGVSYRYCFTR